MRVSGLTHHLPKLGAHIVAALARPHVHNLAQRSSLEAGSASEKNCEEKRRNARNSVGKFGTGKRKCRWRACMYPERENEVVVLLQLLDLLAQCKARRVWAGAAAKYLI